jgi:hypothetical protein
MNTHAAVIARAGASVLADIEGIDGDAMGFCRMECSHPEDKIALSFDALSTHILQATHVPPPQWNTTASNVDGYAELMKKAKDVEKAKATVFHLGAESDAETPAWALVAKLHATGVALTQYSGAQPGELPWTAGAIAVDRSDDRFVFVCSHRVRDARCGYCGPVLVEAIRKEVAAKLGGGGNVHVFACSHVGGHVYAGNVLVYSKHGGVCFGCVTPADVSVLVDFTAGHSAAADMPAELAARVRGAMRPKVSE